MSHHKVHRTPDQNLEFYKGMQSWGDGEVDEDILAPPKASAFVPKTVTYADTRSDNGVDLPLPAVFGGLAAAVCAGAAAAGDPVLALFASPFAAGAVVFATNELAAAPVEYRAGATEALFEREATAVMKTVLGDVAKTRYFEGVHLYGALADWSLAGMGSAAPVLRRVDISAEDDGACAMALVFESAEVPFRLWSALERGGRLEKFFGAPAAVTKVSQADRLVAVTLRSRAPAPAEAPVAVVEDEAAPAGEPEEVAV